MSASVEGAPIRQQSEISQGNGAHFIPELYNDFSLKPLATEFELQAGTQLQDQITNYFTEQIIDGKLQDTVATNTRTFIARAFLPSDDSANQYVHVDVACEAMCLPFSSSTRRNIAELSAVYSDLDKQHQLLRPFVQANSDQPQRHGETRWARSSRQASNKQDAKLRDQFHQITEQRNAVLQEIHWQVVQNTIINPPAQIEPNKQPELDPTLDTPAHTRISDPHYVSQDRQPYRPSKLAALGAATVIISPQVAQATPTAAELSKPFQEAAGKVFLYIPLLFKPAGSPVNTPIPATGTETAVIPTVKPPTETPRPTEDPFWKELLLKGGAIIRDLRFRPTWTDAEAVGGGAPVDLTGTVDGGDGEPLHDVTSRTGSGNGFAFNSQNHVPPEARKAEVAPQPPVDNFFDEKDDSLVLNARGNGNQTSVLDDFTAATHPKQNFVYQLGGTMDDSGTKKLTMNLYDARKPIQDKVDWTINPNGSQKISILHGGQVLVSAEVEQKKSASEPRQTLDKKSVKQQLLPAESDATPQTNFSIAIRTERRETGDVIIPYKVSPDGTLVPFLDNEGIPIELDSGQKLCNAFAYWEMTATDARIEVNKGRFAPDAIAHTYITPADLTIETKENAGIYARTGSKTKIGFNLDSGAQRQFVSEHKGAQVYSNPSGFIRPHDFEDTSASHRETIESIARHKLRTFKRLGLETTLPIFANTGDVRKPYDGTVNAALYFKTLKNIDPGDIPLSIAPFTSDGRINIPESYLDYFRGPDGKKPKNGIDWIKNVVAAFEQSGDAVYAQTPRPLRFAASLPVKPGDIRTLVGSIQSIITAGVPIEGVQFSPVLTSPNETRAFMGLLHQMGLQIYPVGLYDGHQTGIIDTLRLCREFGCPEVGFYEGPSETSPNAHKYLVFYAPDGQIKYNPDLIDGVITTLNTR